MIKNMDKLNIQIIRELLDRPIAFNPAFARIMGNNLAAGMLLSQLFYWAKTKDFKDFYKTSEELQKECFLGRTEFETARKKIVTAKIFTVIKRDVPCKTYYQINSEVLGNLLAEMSTETTECRNLQTRMQESNKLECRNHTNKNVETKHSLNITETTTETTYIDKKVNKKENSEKKKDSKPSISKQINEVIDYYDEQVNTATRRNTSTFKAVTDNLTKILRRYSVDDCKQVIDHILSSTWHRDNGYTKLTTIFRAAKFSEKMLLLDDNPLPSKVPRRQLTDEEIEQRAQAMGYA